MRNRTLGATLILLLLGSMSLVADPIYDWHWKWPTPVIRDNNDYKLTGNCGAKAVDMRERDEDDIPVVAVAFEDANTNVIKV